MRILISTSEAAALIDRSDRHVRNLFLNGTIRGQQTGRNIRVSKASVITYRRRVGLGLIKRGPKPKRRRKARK